MKRLILSMLVVVGFAATSCKKDYTCSCVFGNSTPNVTTFLKVSKSEAKANCVSVKYTETDPDDGSTTSITQTCTLK